MSGASAVCTVTTTACAMSDLQMGQQNYMLLMSHYCSADTSTEQQGDVSCHAFQLQQHSCLAEYHGGVQ